MTIEAVFWNKNTDLPIKKWSPINRPLFYFYLWWKLRMLAYLKMNNAKITEIINLLKVESVDPDLQSGVAWYCV